MRLLQTQRIRLRDDKIAQSRGKIIPLHRVENIGLDKIQRIARIVPQGLHTAPEHGMAVGHALAQRISNLYLAPLARR